ncbi:hypothetical protein Hte_011357 [Hypoxylon texense]
MPKFRDSRSCSAKVLRSVERLSVGLLSGFTRGPNAFVRTQATTRDFWSSPTYKSRSGHVLNTRPGSSKILNSAATSAIIVSLLALVPEETCEKIGQLVRMSTIIDRGTGALTISKSGKEAEIIWRFGFTIAREYFGDGIKTHGVISVLEGTKTQILSAPDPYDAEKRFLLYQSYLHSPGMTEDEDREYHRKFEAILTSKFESQKSELGVSRGLMFTLSSQTARTVYFDGGAFIFVLPSEILGMDIVTHALREICDN